MLDALRFKDKGVNMKHVSKLALLLGVSGVFALSQGFAASQADRIQSAPSVVPGISLGAATGFGASWGQGFVALGAATASPSHNTFDASIVGGMGLGDANKYAAL